MTDLDLRSVPRGDRGGAVFEALDDADPGEELTVLADRRRDALCHRYRIERHRRLRWDAERLDGDGLKLTIEKGDRLPDDELPDVDVREIPPQRRHEVLTDTFDRLDPGEGFVLVNDHDPKPLYHEFRSTRGESFGWAYASRGGEAWRVEIVKTGTTESTADDVAASFDVREIPKPDRHPTIHHRYANIADGETMEIVAPHEPRPLRREFRQRYGDSFAWNVVESEPGRCRVRIRKGVREDATPDDTHAASSGNDALETGDDDPPETGDDDPPETGDDDPLERTEELDVRDLPPARRHERIFETYAALRPGEAFVLVNDHDPKPLYHQFEAEAGDEFRWAYLKREGGEFRVRIGKAETEERETGDVPDGEANRSGSPSPPF